LRGSAANDSADGKPAKNSSGDGTTIAARLHRLGASAKSDGRCRRQNDKRTFHDLPLW
jgi:hypothetical protein